MNSQIHDTPPLSPVLLAGFGLGVLPPRLLQPLLDAAMAMMNRRHPELSARLEGLAGSIFRIDPIDLPFDLVLRLAPAPSLKAVSKEAGGEPPTAAIHGPLLALTQLLEGKLDGDALFFSRDLFVEGDTEAVVTLRNAVDGAGIDLVEDLVALSGPFARPARSAARGAAALFTRMSRDLDRLGGALLVPVARRCETQARELRELRAMVAELRREQMSRAPARRARKRETTGR